LKSEKEKCDVSSDTSQSMDDKKPEILFIMYRKSEFFSKDDAKKNRCNEKSEECECEWRDVCEAPFEDRGGKSPNDVGDDKSQYPALDWLHD